MENRMGIKSGLFALVILSAFLWLQGQVFEYRAEESSAISWNGVSLHDARLLSMGGISLMASGPFSGIENPASPALYDHVVLGASMEWLYFQSFQYWGVNQGVLTAPDGLDDRQLGFSGLSLVFPVRSIRLSLGWYMADRLEYPDFNQDDQYWGYSGDFQGFEQRFFLGAAARVGTRLQLGARLEYGRGERLVDMTEHFFYEGGWYSLVEQRESHRSRSWNLSLGMTYSISPRWELGAVIDYTLYATVERKVDRFFENNFPSPDISDSQSSRDGHTIPLRVKLAGSHLIWQKKHQNTYHRILLAVEAAWINWSSYRYEFFQETMDRDMRDTLVGAAAIEYGCLGERFDYFLRAGYRMDPQPLRDSQTTLHGFTAGVGVGWKGFSADLGMAFFTGSAGGQQQNHFVFCTTLGYSFEGD